MMSSIGSGEGTRGQPPLSRTSGCRAVGRDTVQRVALIQFLQSQQLGSGWSRLALWWELSSSVKCSGDTAWVLLSTTWATTGYPAGAKSRLHDGHLCQKVFFLKRCVFFKYLF